MPGFHAEVEREQGGEALRFEDFLAFGGTAFGNAGVLQGDSAGPQIAATIQTASARAAQDGIDNEEAKRRLLGEKQPSLQFTTPEQLAELALFLCSPAASNVLGVAWAMDGGWTAQ